MHKALGLLLAAGVAIGGAAGVVACSGNDQPRRAVRRPVQRIQTRTAQDDHTRCDPTQPRRTSSEYDTNSDGVPDVRRVYQTMGEAGAERSVLICREVDLNHDGTKDMFRFYNEQGRTLREEEDRDFDGRIDVVTYFEAGEVVRREMDTNGDGRVDMRSFYRDRRPYRAERQTRANVTGEFRPDYWEYYDNRGHVVRIGWDYNGDERADRWDRVDRVVPNRTGEPTASAAPDETGNSPAANPAGPSADPSAAPSAGAVQANTSATPTASAAPSAAASAR